jgi:hypothetical protein
MMLYGMQMVQMLYLIKIDPTMAFDDNYFMVSKDCMDVSRAIFQKHQSP